MILFFILFVKEIIKTGPSNFSIFLKAGQYTISCYGAQGGSSFKGSEKSEEGGKGAYATGTMTVKGTGTTFWAYIGSKGSDSKAGPNPGGYNGGGYGGRDYGSGKGGNDASGGGGGATDFRIDDNSITNRIIVAAGGSGASYSSKGAPGGDMTGYYATNNNAFDKSDKVTQSQGIETGEGGNGFNSNFISGSGGGGGWRGGVAANDPTIIGHFSYLAVSHSGSSYISGHLNCYRNPKMSFVDTEMKSGNKTNNGKIVITFDFECPENCYSCSSSTLCTKCFDGFYMYEDENDNGLKKCIPECPNKYYLLGSTCKKCDPSCKECSGTSGKCISCDDGFLLVENKCIEKCDNGYFESNGTCKKCNFLCSTCSISSDNCTSCIDGYILYENKCISTCPKRTVYNENISTCEFCDKDCNSCYPSSDVCTSCNDGFYLYRNSCIESCPSTTVAYGNQCVDCKSPCKTCSTKYDFCLTCIDKYYFYENKCYASCPSNITIEVNGICIDCQHPCKTCSKSIDQCTSCSDGYYLYDNICIQDCSTKNKPEEDIYYGKDIENHECSLCSSDTCIDCSENHLICTKCTLEYHVENGICIQDPPCSVYEKDSETETLSLLEECAYTAKEDKYTRIYVLLSKYKNYKGDGNGSVIHIFNCGIQCNDTNFVNCVSLSGGGGAVYVRNSYDLVNNATFTNVQFSSCKALYGGAVFIYASSDTYNVSFIECQFKQNEALNTKSSANNNEYLFGGNAVFLSCIEITICNCSFVLNKGKHGSVKIYNNFDEKSKKIQLEENENLIHIHNCNFEKDKNSKSSIHYVTKNSIEIANCNFKGKLIDKSHYIEAKLQVKEELQIKSCQFEDSGENVVGFDMLDNELKVQFDKYDGLIHDNNAKFIITSIIIMIIVVPIFIIIKLKIVDHSRVINKDENELNDLIVNELPENPLV